MKEFPRTSGGRESDLRAYDAYWPTPYWFRDDQCLAGLMSPFDHNGPFSGRGGHVLPPRRIERGGALAALTACTARVDLNGRILNFRRNEPSAEEAQKMEARGSSESIISIFPTHYIDITIRNSGCFHGEASDVFAARELQAFSESAFRRHENTSQLAARNRIRRNRPTIPPTAFSVGFEATTDALGNSRLPLVGHPDPTDSNNIAYLLSILSERGTNVRVP
jgi:hypothetical protein